MATKLLRYVSIGLAAAMVGIAWGDTIYLHSAQDGSISFRSMPTVPRYSAYSHPGRADRPRSRSSESNESCTGPNCDKLHLDSLINDVAHVYGIDSALLQAVVTVESRYNPSARGPGGAAGLMQLMPETAKRYGVENVFDPEQNLRGGARYLRDLLEKFGSDIRLAIAAYQAGEMAVSRYQNSIPPFRTTIEYVSRVLDHYHKFRSTAGR